jgi:transposase InsO family protein
MNYFDPRYMILQEDKLKQIIDKQQTVIQIAKELNVSRQTIHKWLARYKRFGVDGLLIKQTKKHGNAHNRTSPEIEQLVINQANEYFNDGVETLADRIERDYNLTLHPTTIYRILKRNDIRYTERYVHTKKRWKIKLFSHQIPGFELQMDTKYPFGYKQGKVIYTIIDDASRWVFAWVYDIANQENTLDFLAKVFKRAPFVIQKIRTDQGKEFVGLRVKEFLKQKQIAYRNNTPYCPEENGKIERFHRTLNDKLISWILTPRDSLEQIQYQLSLFLQYYNYLKKHRGLGMNGLTPMQKLNQCASVNLTLQCNNF